MTSPTRELLAIGLSVALINSAFPAEKKSPGQSAEIDKAPQPNVVFLCKDGGKDVYTNSRLNKRCQSVALFSLPAKPAASPQHNAAPAGANASFPRVSSTSQKLRDEDRKSILDQELQLEQKSLAAARSLLDGQKGNAPPDEALREKVRQHERNINALRTELKSLK